MRSTFYIEGIRIYSNGYDFYCYKELLGRDSATQYHAIFCVIATHLIVSLSHCVYKM